MMHSVYQKKLSKNLEKWQRRKSRTLKEEWLEAAMLLMSLNLDPVADELKNNPRGR